MKKIIWILVIVILGLLIGYLYVFHKPHRDYIGEEAAYKVEAPALVQSYQNDKKAADTKYLDKVIDVKGNITEMDNQHLKLNDKIYCTLDSATATPQLQVGDMVTMKGRVVGFDDLFGEVRLDNCVVQGQ